MFLQCLRRRFQTSFAAFSAFLRTRIGIVSAFCYHGGYYSFFKFCYIFSFSGTNYVISYHSSLHGMIYMILYLYSCVGTNYFLFFPDVHFYITYVVFHCFSWWILE